MILHLSVDKDPDAGFCFGVERAIEIAESLLTKGQEVYCLGEIVHNSEEVRRLENLGMKTITHQDLDLISGKNVLVRSHGEPPETYELIRKNGNTLVEATCPIVLKLQERVKKDGQTGRFILIFGKEKHPEVIGLTGHLDTTEYLVFHHPEVLDLSLLPHEVTLYSQTTMDPDLFQEAQEILKNGGIQVQVKDTICRKVSGKREKLKIFAAERDVVLMVAGKNSSNGRVLFEVCRAANPASYLITRPDEIDPSWFLPRQKVGITGATSTPGWQMDAVAKHLKTL